MKKIVGLLLAVVMALSIATPAMANDVNVTTGVTVTQGGGNAPVIKCKWETPDDGDPTHVIPGTQVAPPLVYQGLKPVTLYVVVTDVEDAGSVAQVVADVYHPAGLPENGSIKYDNLALVKLEKFSVGIPAFQEANTQGLIAYNPLFNYAEVLDELQECFAEVWAVTFDMHYHQPWGGYPVNVMAVDTHGNSSAMFSNVFTYVQMCGIETDFTSVTYPPVMISSDVWVGGDADFTTPLKPTIRNIGNTNANLFIWQDDMGFGTYADGTYKVEFDARLGPQADPTDTTKIVFDPEVTTKFPNILPLCNTIKMDFSIHVKFALPGNYTGDMVLSCTSAPFGP